MKSLADCRLYTFVDSAWLEGRSPEELTRQLCEGGSDLIQIRAKNATADEVRRLTDLLLAITEPARVRLVVNDHLAVALAANAPVVHLGQEDFFDSGFTHRSQLLPPNSSLELGLSTHAPEQANRAVRAGADYVAIGPVFPTDTKPAAQPVTLDYVRWAARAIQIPWFAIGGIHLENLDAVIEAGARRVCVVSAILKASDVARACHEFKQRLTSAAQ
jgi:thiamine-phosphate pyrophosphorylase